MATPTLRPPVDSEIFIKEARNSRPWLNFFRQLARLFESLRGVATISTSDITASGITVSSPDVAAVTSPLITSANAGTMTGAYVQADVQRIATLADELKTDVNALVVIQNTDKDLTNELKADLATLVAKVDTMATLVNELKAAHNAIVNSVTQ
jgi:hypothetical protein